MEREQAYSPPQSGKVTSLLALLSRIIPGIFPNIFQGLIPSSLGRTLQGLSYGAAPRKGVPKQGSLADTLASREEPKFQNWYAKVAEQLGINPNPDDPRHFYDYRGAFRQGVNPDPVSGHFPDTYKLPGHPTFSVESQYYKPGMPAVKWEGERPIPYNEWAVSLADLLGVPKGTDVRPQWSLQDYIGM